MHLWNFVKYPDEERDSSKNSWTHLFYVFFLYVSISVVTKLLNVLILSLLDVSIPSRSVDFVDWPILFVIIIPPLFEELAFRLPLKRTKLNVFISLFFISFLIISKFLCSTPYSTCLLIERIGFSFAFASLSFCILYRWVVTLQFRMLFYMIAFLFAGIHALNYYPITLSWNITIYILSYCFLIIPDGIILGYIRIKFGLWYAVCFHIFHNMPFIVIAYCVG